MKGKFPLAILLTLLFAFPNKWAFAKRIMSVSGPATWYVSSTTGHDTRTGTTAQNRATPFESIGKALSVIAPYDTIKVIGGTYNEIIVIDQTVKLIGEAVGGVKPLLGSATVGSGHNIITIGADSLSYVPNVTISNFTFEVNLITSTVAISSSVNDPFRSTQNRFSGIEVSNNDIYSTAMAAPSNTFSDNYKFETFGIYLIGAANSNSDTVLITGNTIAPKFPSTPTYFGRGIRVRNCQGVVSNNSSKAYYSLQFGGPRAPLTVQNNTLNGYTELFSGGSSTITVKDNTFLMDHHNPLFFFALLEIKALTSANSNSEITNNTFSGYVNYGLALDLANGISVSGNVFTPSDTGTNYTSVALNTKLSTVGTFLPEGSVCSDITIQNNTFNAGSVVGGTAVGFSNHNGDATVTPFSNITLGGAGALANTMAKNHKFFIAMDGQTGDANSIPLWNDPLNSTSTMVPTKFNLNASENSYELSGGFVRGTNVTLTDAFELEDKIRHSSDYGKLGNIYFSGFPNTVFISGNSFYLPYTTFATPQYAIDAGAGTVYVNSANFATNVKITNNVNLKGIAPITFDSLTISSGRTLTLFQPLTVVKRFVLSSGKLKLNGNMLTTSAAIMPSGGSTTAFVITDSMGVYKATGVGSAAIKFPIGSATAYAPVTLQDANNTQDDFSAWVRDVNAIAAFYPALPGAAPAFVTKRWELTEGTPGGSNASVTFGWTAASEFNPPLNIGTIAARYTGTEWAQTYTNYNGNSTSLSNVSAFGKFAVYSYQRLAQISSFKPGIAFSGHKINIYGGGFTGASQVLFGGVPASSFVVLNDSTILATVGADGASGTITVVQSFGALTSAKGLLYYGQVNNVVVTGLSGCGGSTASVSFSKTGAYASGNVFTVRLYNASTGKYYYNLGSGTSSPITATIPLKVESGEQYYFSVVASAPMQANQQSEPSVSAYTLTSGYNPSVSIAQTSVTPLCAGGQISFEATGSDMAPVFAYQWQVNAQDVSGATGSTFSSSLQNGDVVSVKLSNSALCTFGPALSNSITISGQGAACSPIWTGAAGTDWNNASNWNGGVPTGSSTALIPATSNQPVITGSANTGNLQIDRLATVSNNGILFLAGNAVNNGSFTGGALTFLGTGTLSGNAFEVTDASLSAGSQLTLAATLGVKNRVSVIPSSSLTSNGYLTLRSSATGTAYIDGLTSNYSLTGDINVERYVGGFAAGGHQVGPMVKNFKPSKLGVNSQSLLFFYEDVNKWDHPTLNDIATQPIPAGNSFSFQTELPTRLTFTGPAMYQDTTLGLFRGPSGLGRGFNALCNPYPKPLSWAAVVAGNANNPNTFLTLWIWNNAAGQYATVTLFGVAANGGTDQVDVGQGFLVRRSTIGSSGGLDMKYSYTMAPSGPSFMRKPALAHSLRLKLYQAGNAQQADEAVIYTHDEAQTDEDRQDGEKLYSHLPVCGISSGNDMAINALPTDFTGSIPLHLKAPKAGMYTLSVAELSGLQVQLEDKATGTLTTLQGSNNLALELNTDNSNRFLLHFNNAKTTGKAGNEASIFSSDKQVTVLLPTEGMATIEAVNSLGQVVKTINHTTGSVVRFGLMHDGVYTIRVKHEAGIQSTKIIY
jgi:hypothetical protein